jgi:Cytochrome P450
MQVFNLESKAMECPHAHYRAIQQQEPVHFSQDLGIWLVTSYDLVAEVYEKPNTFSSSISIGPRGHELYAEMLRMAKESPELADQVEGYGATPRNVLLWADPPIHTRQRAFVNPTVTPAKVRRYEDRFAAIAHDLVAKFVESGSVEFISQFARPYTMRCIAELLGLPDEVERLGIWSGDFMRALVGDPPTSEELKELAKSRLDFDMFFTNLIEERRGSDGDDLISQLTQTRKDGALEIDEMLPMIQQMLVGGNETSASNLANTMIRLAEDGALFERVAADKTLIPALLEEVLRAETPGQMNYRLATEDAELGGKTIRAGDVVCVVMGATGHDPAEYTNAHELDLGRPKIRHHQAFGWGPHVCVGQHFARLEMRVALEALMANLADLRLSKGEPNPVYARSATMHGPTSVNFEFTQRV